MKLHLDKDSFKLLIEKIAKRTGYREDVIEKDYYVVLVLKELSDLQKDGLPAYFKGGTALYKALKTTNRFSEDIDLSVDGRGLSRTQNDKLLSSATKHYSSLVRDRKNSITHRSEVITIYDYAPITSYDSDDMLQRFGKIKVEATSFTISEPHTKLTVSSMIYDLATDEEKQILENQYGVYPFEVETITLERIFIDKLFAAESYVRKSNEKAFEASKHIYDLAVMETHPAILSFLQNEQEMEELIAIRLEEEKNRLDGIPDVMPNEFLFFTRARYDQKIRTAYEIMQSQYVFRNEDRIEFDAAIDRIERLGIKLGQNLAWSNEKSDNICEEQDNCDPNMTM